MPVVQSMPQSHESSKLEGGKGGTSTRAGESKESPPSEQTSTRCLSPTKSKTDGVSGFSTISSTNPGLVSTLSDNEGEVEATKRKCELEGYNSIRTGKKKRGSLPVVTANHMKLRAAGDAGDNWWHDLTRKHGLTEEEAIVVWDIVTKNLNEEEFPPVCEGSKREYFLLAKEGWRLMKELNALVKLYPKENAKFVAMVRGRCVTPIGRRFSRPVLHRVSVRNLQVVRSIGESLGEGN